MSGYINCLRNTKQVFVNLEQFLLKREDTLRSSFPLRICTVDRSGLKIALNWHFTKFKNRLDQIL